jgi:predicted NBD/HSP70 family sugar kinase
MPGGSARPARQRSLREANLALALRHVASAAVPASRADIAAATGLTRSTASTLVDALLAAGLIRELDPVATTGAGRPATGLVLSPDCAAGMGLEVNVDYLAVCVVDLGGSVRHRAVALADQRGRAPSAVLADLADLAASARDSAMADGVPVAGARLAVPGLVQSGQGLLRLAPNLGWRDVDVLRPLAEDSRLAGLSLSVDNEANLAALGELYRGGAEGAQSFLHVSGEIGVGAGIVLQGRLFRGVHGWGGEIGHMAIDPDGPVCACGSRGCLEQLAGQEVILRAAGLRTPAGTTMAGQAGLGRLVRRAEAMDPDLLFALEQAGTALGVAVAGVVNLIDVDTVVLGGLYAALAPWVQPPVEREVAGRVLAHPWSPVQVTVSQLGGDAAILGGAGAVLQEVLDHPAGRLAGAGRLGTRPAPR